MACPKSVRIAAIVSQVILVLWILLTIISNVFQEQIALLYYGYQSEWERTFSWGVIAMCIADLLITAANLQICRGKGKTAPLVTAAVTTGALPIVCFILRLYQNIFTARLGGTDDLARLNIAMQTSEILSYFLYAGAVITTAAAAVYAYAPKSVTADQSAERSDYDTTYNIN